MNAEVSLERFEALANAFGGDVVRWPIGERAGAMATMAARPGETARLLETARTFDAILSAASIEAPSPTLLGAIIRNATIRPAPSPLWRWLIGLGVAAGLAGAAAAGIAAGLVIAPVSVAPRPQPASADPIAQASALLGDAPDLADG